MSEAFQNIAQVLYLLVLFVLILQSIVIVYRNPRFALLVYAKTAFIIMVLVLLFGILVLYGLLSGLFIRVAFLEVFNSTGTVLLLLPGAMWNARRGSLLRFIWLRRVFYRFHNLKFSGFLTVSIITGFIAAVYSMYLFALTRPDIDPRFLEELERAGLEQPGSEFVQFVLVLSAAVSEEIIFRLAFISVIIVLLKPWRITGIVVSLVLSSMLWTLMHTGMATPLGVKELQIFIIGIMFGLLFLRYGVEASIIAHCILNMYISMGLIY